MFTPECIFTLDKTVFMATAVFIDTAWQPLSQKLVQQHSKSINHPGDAVIQLKTDHVKVKQDVYNTV